jgi:Putative MetA-pathway of phenol degradation
VFGASADPYLNKGEWLFGAAARGLRSHDHYSGTVEQTQRQDNKNYVVNEQYALDLSGMYAVTRRFSVAGAMPLVRASWSIPLPTTPGALGPRSEQNAQGIGDITVVGRAWMFDPDAHQRGNLSLGLGLKAPTGNYDATDSYPILNGTNPQDKAVDQSIQPGDRGWGAIFDIAGFKRLGTMSFYGSGTYLINPRDTNGTPSIIAGLFGGGAVPPAQAGRTVNSVPDQYVLRTGAAFALGKSPFSAAVGFRMEGLPRYDLIGDSHGFRRPGYETFAEPGFYYSRGPDTWSLNVPIALKRNRLPDPYTGAAGDATFPNYIVLVGFTHRFGALAATPQAWMGRPSEPRAAGAPSAACAEPRFDSPAEGP